MRALLQRLGQNILGFFETMILIIVVVPAISILGTAVAIQQLFGVKPMVTWEPNKEGAT